MAKQVFNPKADTLARIKRTDAYAEKVRLLFAQTVNAILALNKTMPQLDEGVMFSFDGESLKKQKEVEVLLRRLHSAATLAIKNGVRVEWDIANQECDRLVSSVFGKKILESPMFSAWVQRNEAARDAFIDRTEKGMNLSDRVWKSVQQLRDEMEIAMTVSIGEGESASSMSRKVRQYLNDPDLMFRRFRYKKDEDEDGNPIWGRKWKKRVKDEATGKYRWIDYDRDDYETGRGVYKSSAKNAMRVARTETNMAYRRADHERWDQLDFVLGQRVQLSKNHPKKDICDKLQGDYPKDFVFDGWHPQCFCFVTPILMDEEEMAKVNEAFLKGEKYIPKGKRITDYPQNFKDWVTDHAEDIAMARSRGTEPYFIRNNAAAIDEILDPEEKELTTLEKAAIRHEARTPEQEEAIRKAWEERQKKNALIKKAAGNVLNVAQDYGEVDYSELQAAIDAGDLIKMQMATKAVAQAVSAMKKQEAAISELIPNAHTLHQSYSMNELSKVYKELDGVMKKWLSKYGYSSLDAAPLKHLKNKLDFELTSPSVSYSNKDIIKKAIIEKMRLIDQKIEWENLIQQAASLQSFKTKSPVFKGILTKIEDAINSNDFNALQKSITEAETQRRKLIDKSIKRGGDTKSALNKEYKGAAVGKDLTVGLDVNNLTTTDQYYGEKRYTNEVAKMQGFDAPAKLVSVNEFDKLEIACGEVFYRTVNPIIFKGKRMSGDEFARQMYLADSMELNGPGGRAYGDGIYVATAGWDGGKVVSLSKISKQTAYSESACYGHSGCKTLEMTWVRVPKIIKQSDLNSMWRKLTPKQRKAFGNHENTYACALGYDGMYCDGPNYMVIWNRSIIAVKDK